MLGFGIFIFESYSVSRDFYSDKTGESSTTYTDVG